MAVASDLPVFQNHILTLRHLVLHKLLLLPRICPSLQQLLYFEQFTELIPHGLDK